MKYRENQIIHGNYHGVEYRGICVNSRAALGGQIKHTVALFEPIWVFDQCRKQIVICETQKFFVEENVENHYA